jgi:HD-like signal output (HDOD) protein
MTNPTATPTIDLSELLKNAQLPALPQSAIRLLDLSKDPENGPAEFAVPIEADPGLTSQVLRFVNSSYFGFAGEISTVKLAITLVGVRTIKNFAIWSAVFSLMANPKCGALDVKQLWQDSLTRALFSRALGKHMGLADAEEAFAAALLQDMAVPLLAKELPDAYAELFEMRAAEQAKLSDLERQRFGWTHADAATEVAKTWNLPEDFARMISSHTDMQALLDAGDSKPDQLAVALSALLPAASDEQWLDFALFEAAYNGIADGKCPPIDQLFEQVDADYAEFAPVLDMDAAAKSLTDYLSEAKS